MKTKGMQSIAMGLFIIVFISACSGTPRRQYHQPIPDILPVMPLASMVATSQHTMVIGVDSSLWGMGDNLSGQLGCGNNLNRNFFDRTGTSYDWYIVTTGWRHTVALKTDGTMWAWGNNTSGELGDGTIIRRHEPIQVGIDADWMGVAAGGSQTYAIKQNGTLWAWGNNRNGNLGIGRYIENPERIFDFEYMMNTDFDWDEFDQLIIFSINTTCALFVEKNSCIWIKELCEYYQQTRNEYLFDKID